MDLTDKALELLLTGGSYTGGTIIFAYLLIKTYLSAVSKQLAEINDSLNKSKDKLSDLDNSVKFLTAFRQVDIKMVENMEQRVQRLEQRVNN